MGRSYSTPAAASTTAQCSSCLSAGGILVRSSSSWGVSITSVLRGVAGKSTNMRSWACHRPISNSDLPKPSILEDNMSSSAEAHLMPFSCKLYSKRTSHKERWRRHMFGLAEGGHERIAHDNKAHILLTSKKWRLQRAGRQSRRQGVEMKSDWLFHKPRSNYWLRVAASNLASQSPCLAGVTRSQCNPQ